MSKGPKAKPKKTGKAGKTKAKAGTAKAKPKAAKAKAPKAATPASVALTSATQAPEAAVQEPSAAEMEDAPRPETPAREATRPGGVKRMIGLALFVAVIAGIVYASLPLSSHVLAPYFSGLLSPTDVTPAAAATAQNAPEAIQSSTGVRELSPRLSVTAMNPANTNVPSSKAAPDA